MTEYVQWFKQGSNCGGGKVWSYSTHTLNVKLLEFAEKKRLKEREMILYISISGMEKMELLLIKMEKTTEWMSL